MSEFRITVDDVLTAGGPWYGLPNDGRMLRAIRGHGGSRTEHHLRLQHQWGRGDVWVAVETSTESEPVFEPERALLSQWATLTTFLREIGPEDFPVRLEARRWTVHIPVDDAPVEFVVIGDEATWGAFAVVRGRRVRLESRLVPVDRISLVDVDPSAYERSR